MEIAGPAVLAVGVCRGVGPAVFAVGVCTGWAFRNLH